MMKTRRRGRTTKFQVLLTPRERETLERLADHKGVDMADIVRGWINQEAVTAPMRASNP
jgi:hypothetical protein